MKTEHVILILVLLGLGGAAFYFMSRQNQNSQSLREVKTDSSLGDQIGAAATGVGNSIDALSRIFGGF